MNLFLRNFSCLLDAMKQTNQFWKFVLLTVTITFFAVSGILLFLWQALTQDEIQAVKNILTDHLPLVFSLIFLLICVLFAGLKLIFLYYIKPLKQISAEASLIYSSNPSH